MIGILLGVFFVLHGLVHLLYTGQSLRVFELEPGMTWPDGALALRFLGAWTTRNLAGILLALAAVGFVVGSFGIFFKAAWWRAAIVSAAVFSTVIYLLLWDGGLHDLDSKGLIGILINLAILASLLIFRWPNFEV